MHGIVKGISSWKRILLVLPSFLIVLSGCSSNEPPQPQAHSSAKSPKAAEASKRELLGASESEQRLSAAATEGGGDASRVAQGELDGIEGVQIEPGAPVTGDQVAARVSFASTTPQPAGLVYKWKKNGLSVQESTSQVLSVPVKRDDFVEVEVLSSEKSASSSKSVSGSAMVGNAPPSMRLANQGVGNDGVYQAKVESTDPEGDNFTLSIKDGPAGMTIDPQGNIRWALDSKAQGAFSVAVSARDVHGAETSLTYQIKIRRETDGKAS